MELALAQVLIIDDNPQVLTLISTALSGLVSTIRKAPDAIAGLGQWITLRPQLIFVDYEMPELNGPTFVRILRAQEAALGLRTAVLMVTGHSDRDHVLSARNAGADGFIVKPLEADAIIGRAVKVLATIPAAGET